MVAVLAGLLLAGCSSPSDPAPASPSPAESPGAGASETPTPSQTPAPAPEAEPQRLPRVSPDDVRVQTATRTVEHLAGVIGPRPGHTPAYFEAAAWVQGRLEADDWQVRRQRFPTPGGVSWGVPVDGGPSVNLVATRGDVRPGRPWLLVGAHLDTVPQAPGAEDNASDVGSLLAVAQAVAEHRTRLPVVLVAFGSEEPRGPTDDDHHYGSRAFVASLSPAERDSLRGMVSLDRVGVGGVLPVCSPDAPTPLRAELLAAAERASVATLPCTDNRASDHWSFVRDGLPGVRLGSTSYAAYHSAADVPTVVDPAQLERTARTVVAWLR